MKNLSKKIVFSTSILVGGVISPLNQGGIDLAEAATVSHKAAFQTISNINLRSGAGTHYNSILTIPKGMPVTSTERNGSWYKVSYTYSVNGKKRTVSGWVSGTYIKVKAHSAASSTVSTNITRFPKTNFQTSDNLNLRTGAGSNFKSIITIPKGKIVSSIEKKGNWYRVSYTYTLKGRTVTISGWVIGNFLKEYYSYGTISGTYLFTKKTVSIYATPDTKKKALFTVNIDNGFYSNQKIMNSTGQTWYRVSYNGKTGFIHGNEVISNQPKTFASTKYRITKATSLYASFGNSYSKLSNVVKDTLLTSSYSVGNWYKVTLNGKTGFVHISDMIKDVAPPSVPAPVTPPAQPEPQVPVPVPVPVPATFTETALYGKTFVTTANVNLRKAADTNSELLVTIPTAKFIAPTHKVSNGWFKFTYGGKTGYVSGEFVKDVITGDPMNRNGYQFIDLRKPSKVTAEQINTYINNYVKLTGKTSVLSGKGHVFINAGNKYGVNALYLAAHAILESGYGTSNIALGKNNLFGFGAYDSTPFVASFRFSSVDQCIDYIAQEVKATYLEFGHWKFKGYHLGFRTNEFNTTTRIDANSEGANFYYATDVKWGSKIASHMQNILAFNATDYAKSTPNTNLFDPPSRPAGVEVFPSGILAIANSNLNGSLIKDSTTKDITITKGITFTLLEKHNDFSVKVRIGDRDYWTKDIIFYTYKNNISVKNLGRVTNTRDYVNVRVNPSTSQTEIARLNLNDYVHLVLDSTGQPTMDVSKTWYNVKLANGTTGWVSASYIVQELK